MMIFKIIYWLGIAGQIAIRYPWQRVWRKAAKTEQRITPTDKGVLFMLLVGGFVVPLIYSVTDWLAFADYQLPVWASWLGMVVLTFSLYLFWLSHRDLKENWSPSLEIFKEHRLVTSGIYKVVRHPMYFEPTGVNAGANAVVAELDCRTNRPRLLHSFLRA